MKKGIKFLIIVLCLVIVGLITYIVLDKTILSKNNKNEANGINVASNEAEKKEQRENIDNIIKTEISKKEFISKNGISESKVNNLEYCVVNTKDNPIYLVLVGYQLDGQAGHGKIFQVVYKDGKVSFSEIEDHKYQSDTIEYDTDKEILRLSATYHGGTRRNYFKLKDGKFESIDLEVNDESKEYNFKNLEIHG